MSKQSLKLNTADTTTTTDREEGGGFLRENVRTLGIIGLLLLVALGGIYYYFYRQGKANDQAQIELARVRSYYDKSDFPLAINGDTSKTMGGAPIHGLRYIVSEWKSTPAGKIAALYLGNSYLASGQADKAAEPFEVATGSDEPLVRSAAHAGLGAVKEAAKKYEEAAKEYEKAASEDRIELNTPQYLLDAARNYELVGKKQEAIEQYRRVATQYPDSPVNTQARMALARNNVEL
jgi:tetratricopeptide (TPR) repeat protein